MAISRRWGRVGRYILQELFGYAYKPFRDVNWLPGMLVTSVLVSLSWGYLLWTGDISTIWPLFGVTNQTLSALALAVGTTIVLRVAKRKVYALVTFVPCVFITVVTFTAGYLNFQTYWAQDLKVCAWLSIGILIAVAVIIADNIRVWLKLLKTIEPAGLNTPTEPEELTEEVPE